MKRVCRRLAVAVAVLVWLGALVYLLVLSRRRLPELGSGISAGAGGGLQPGNSEVKSLCSSSQCGLSLHSDFTTVILPLCPNIVEWMFVFIQDRLVGI